MFKVCLDAGHGLYTAGKRCSKSIDLNETREWVLNARICDLVQKKLHRYKSVTLIRSDNPNGKTDIPLKERCIVANDWKADLFISIHHNAGANRTSAGGTVVYSYIGTKHDFVKELYTKLVAHTGLVGNRSEGCLQDSFSVLKYTHMPAVLIENGFMDSTTDTPIILTEEHAEKTAQAIASFIIEYAYKEGKAEIK